MKSFSPVSPLGDGSSAPLRRSRRPMTIRLLLGGATILASVAAYVSYTVTRDLLLDSLKANVLEDVQLGGGQLDQWLIERQTEVKTIANTPTLRSMDWGLVEPFLKPELSRLSDFHFFAMIRPDGSYHNTVHGEAKGKNLRDRKHVQKSLAGQTYISDPVISRTLGDAPIVAVTTPIYQDVNAIGAAPIGVLAGLINIDRLREVVGDLSYGEGSYAFALNSEGLAISHPDASLMSTINDEKPKLLTDASQGELGAIARKMVEGESDIQRIQHQEESVYVAFLPLQEADWSIALVIPRQNIESQLRLLDLMAVLVACIALASLGLLLRVQQSEQRRLKESKALSDSANQAKSEFLSNMSHELRTPLNAILGFGQLMRNDSSLTQRHRDSLNIIHRSGEHLLALINDVLAMSKIEAGRVSLNENEFSLLDFLDDLQGMLKLKAQEKGLELIVERSPELPSHLFADEGKLRQILINLLNNALKFTETGYVKLYVMPLLPQSDSQSDLVSEGISEDRVRLCFSVRDSGPGIAPGELKDLFVSFAQTETGRKSQMGTGLGLPISRTFARLMKGDITVTSELGQGSEFSCEIQAQRMNRFNGERESQAEKWHQIRGLAPGQPRYRMLIAEDNVYSRQLLMQLLESVGFEVEAVANGANAIERWKAWQPHMLWMDLRMPVMGGLEAAAAIKAAAALENDYVAPAIVAVTANAFESDRAQALEAGYDDFVAKPYAHRTIFEKIAMHLAVEYDYEPSDALNIAEATDGFFELSAASFEVMPLEWQEALSHAALSLNHQVMEDLLEEIPAEHCRFQAAVNRVIQELRYDILQDFLQGKDLNSIR